MKVDAGLIGLEQTLQSLSDLANTIDWAAEEALKYILQQMCEYVVANGPWKDHTTNLRNSISINIDTMKEWSADTAADTLTSLVAQNQTPVIKVEGGNYVGCISAGMEYAIWVETKGGYWVLQGAIDHFEPLIEKYFADKMSIDKLDLEEAATVAYLKYQTNKQFGR